MRLAHGLCLAALLCAPAHAAPLSRRRALEIVMRQNPQIAAARADVEGVVAQKRQADALRWPEITLDVGFGPAQKATLVPGTAIQSREDLYSIADLTVFMRGDLQILQPLYTFGKIGHRRAAAEHGIRARKAQVEVTKADLALEVARLYEGFLYARDAQRLFEEIDRIVGQSVQETAEKLKRGKTQLTEQDVLRLQTSQTLARNGLTRALAAGREAAAGLQAYLALPASEVTPAEDTLIPIAATLPDGAELVGVALNRRSELVALHEGAVAYDRLAAAERAGYWPDFFLLGLVSGAYTPGRDLVTTRYYADPLYHFYPAIVAGMRWTVWASLPGGRADEVRAQAHKLDATRKWAVQGIPAEVQRALEEAHRAQRDLDEGGPAVTRAKQWLVHATADYDIGMGDSRSVSDAAAGYVMVRTGQLDAGYRWNLALAELARVTGTLTDGTGPYPGKEAGK